jgi:hypothetical protein
MTDRKKLQTGPKSSPYNPATMTDKEIALALGIRLISARFRIAAMTGELTMYRTLNGAEIPWRDHVDSTLSQSLSHDFEMRIGELSRELAAANPEDLLRTLHSFLAESLNFHEP